ncbi:MAG: hypothetical protein C0478_08660 [Planctomyces sp.]|nr:hypothetical protein [Planctomyces sp.]
MGGSANDVVITGLGAVTAAGLGTDRLWRGLIRGKSLITRHETTSFDNEGPSEGWPDSPFPQALWPEEVWGGFLPHELRGAGESSGDPLELAALWAVREAWEQAGCEGQVDPLRVGCAFGTSKGGVHAATNEWLATHRPPTDRPTNGVTHFPDSWKSDGFLSVFPHHASTLVANACGARGPRSSPIAACATGLAAAILGARWIEEDLCDVVITGSADAALHPLILAAFNRLGVLASRRNAPRQIMDRVEDGRNSVECRPFDAYRHGFVVGEGAGCLILERESQALARRQPLLARWCGGRQLTDAASLMQPDPAATSLKRLITDTLKHAAKDPHEIGYINAHGTGTSSNDLVEIQALRETWGTNRLAQVPISSFKGTVGHLLGAAGSVELVGTVLALQRRLVPPTANRLRADTEFADCCLPEHAMAMPRPCVLKLSSGFGGHLMAAIIELAD